MNTNNPPGAVSPEIPHGLELAEGEFFTHETLAELSDGKGDDDDE